MSNFKILLIREFKSKFKTSAFDKQRIFNSLLSLIITSFLVVVAVFVFKYFVSVYIQIKHNYETVLLLRCEQLFTMIFLLSIICAVFVATIKISNIIANQKDIKRLMFLPVSLDGVFWVKMLSILFDIFYITVLMIGVLSLVVCLVAQLSLGVYLKCLLFSIILGGLAFAFGSLLALPYYYLKRFFKNKFLFTIVIFTVLLVSGFLIYSQILIVVKSMLESGQIKFLFNEKTMVVIGQICHYAFSSNSLAKMAINNIDFLNLAQVLIIFVGCMLLAYFVVNNIFSRAVRGGGISYNNMFQSKTAFKVKSPLKTLCYKEFISVLREPSLAFQYFVISLSLPLLVYSTASILVELLQNLVFIDCSFAVSLVSACAYAIVTNTFCATNISREGRFFNRLKILPITTAKILFIKIMFCSIVSVISILLTGIVLAVFNIVSVLDAIVIVILVSVVSIGEICIATKKDLNKPSFSRDKSKAVPTVNFIVFWGLLSTLLLGFVSVGGTILFTTIINVSASKLFVMLLSFGVASIVCLLSIVYLCKGLSNKFSEVVYCEE